MICIKLAKSSLFATLVSKGTLVTIADFGASLRNDSNDDGDDDDDVVEADTCCCSFATLIEILYEIDDDDDSDAQDRSARC